MSESKSTRWLWMLIASAVLCQIALNLARPLISYKVLALGGDSVAVGLTSASFALLPVAIALWLGRMSDRRTSMKGITVAGTLLLAAGPFLLLRPHPCCSSVSPARYWVLDTCASRLLDSPPSPDLSRSAAWTQPSAGSPRHSPWASSLVHLLRAWQWDRQETPPPPPGSWTPTQH